MRYQILIDRTTIRRNQNAGQTEMVVPGIPKTILLVSFFHPDPCIARDIYDGLVTLIAFFDGEVSDSDVHSYDGRACKYTISAILLSGKDIDWSRIANSLRAIIAAAGGRVEDLCASATCPVHRYFHEPIPLYSYVHVSMSVECSECGAHFQHEELASDESADGEDYCTTICPRCGAWGCCDLEYEQLTEEIAMAALAVQEM